MLRSQLNNIHLLHEEGGVTIPGDAFLQAVIKVQLIAFDNAFEAEIADLTGKFLLEAAQRKVVGGEER